MVNNCFAIFKNQDLDDSLPDLIVGLESFLKSKIEIIRNEYVDYEFIRKRQSLLHYHGMLYSQPEGLIIYADNSGDISEEFMYRLSQSQQKEIMHFRIYEEGFSESCLISYFKDGRQQRVVYAMRVDDESWMYYEKGTFCETDSIDHFMNRINAKRFTKNVLFDYLATTGFPIMQKSFWVPDSEIFLLKRTVEVAAVNS